MAIQDFLSIGLLRKSVECGRDGIVAATAPGVAAREARQPEEQPPPCAVCANRSDKVVRTGGFVPAAAARPGERMECRRDGVLVDPRECDEQVFHSERVKIESRPARSNHSARSSAKPADAAADLATTTMRSPGAISGRDCLKISRSLRRMRFRTTATPTRREVTMPTDFNPSPNFKTPTLMKGPWA